VAADSSAALAAPPPLRRDTPACLEFQRLAAQVGVDAPLAALAESDGAQGRALVATRDAQRGTILMAVPK
jgi:hypothetical protein